MIYPCIYDVYIGENGYPQVEHDFTQIEYVYAQANMATVYIGKVWLYGWHRRNNAIHRLNWLYKGQTQPYVGKYGDTQADTGYPKMKQVD